MQDVRAAKACRTFAETFHPECFNRTAGERGETAPPLSRADNGSFRICSVDDSYRIYRDSDKGSFEICMDQFLRRRRFKGRKMVRTSFSDCMEYPAA